MTFIFVSYGLGDGKDVEPFLRELCDSIAALVGAAEETRSYVSSDAGVVGGNWAPQAAKALAECTIFVAVCSERYFLTDRCGREWWTFADRCRQYDAATSRRPRSIIPIAWGREAITEPLPGNRYVSTIASGDDMRALSRLSTYRERFADLIGRLAQHIVHEAKAAPMPPAVSRLPYADTPNAFEASGNWGKAVAGRRHGVRFVVAAGRRDEMASLRGDTEFYGNQPLDWNPYRVEGSEPLARRAQHVATDQLFYSEIGDNVEEVVDVIERAGANDELVVLLVDAWAVGLETCRRALSEIDRRGSAKTAIVVPISASDPETMRERLLLGRGVRHVLHRVSGRGGPMLRIGPDSSAQFEEELGSILETARNLAFRTSVVRRTAPATRARTLPLLDAP